MLGMTLETTLAQGWIRGFFGGRGFQRIFTAPVAEAEPQPEPEVFRSWKLTNPYRVPVPEPEPEPLQRLSRRLINSRATQNLLPSRKSSRKISTSVIDKISPVSSATSRTEQLDGSSNRRDDLLKILEETFPKVKPTKSPRLEPSQEVQLNAWPVDSTQFEVVPAVPNNDSEDGIDANSVIKSLIQFAPVPAVPKSELRTKDRKPKKISAKTNETKQSDCISGCVETFCVNKDDSEHENCIDKCNKVCN